MNVSRLARTILPAAFAVLTLAGCSHTYGPPPPPPPPYYQGAPPLIQQAEGNGLRAGREDGARDAYQRRGYAPTRDARFHNTPGYDPAFGPFNAYRATYRNAYERGYYQGFTRP